VRSTTLFASFLSPKVYICLSLSLPLTFISSPPSSFARTQTRKRAFGVSFEHFLKLPYCVFVQDGVELLRNHGTANDGGGQRGDDLVGGGTASFRVGVDVVAVDAASLQRRGYSVGCPRIARGIQYPR